MKKDAVGAHSICARKRKKSMYALAFEITGGYGIRPYTRIKRTDKPQFEEWLNSYVTVYGLLIRISDENLDFL